MLRKDIAALSLKISCEYIHPVKRYGKTNMIVFVLSLCAKYRRGLTSFCQLLYIHSSEMYNNYINAPRLHLCVYSVTLGLQ